MECAGNGRALMPPRAESQPWPPGSRRQRRVDRDAAPADPGGGRSATGRIALVFTGADHGIQGDVEQDYQWGFSLDDILRDEVLLAYEMNGQPPRRTGTAPPSCPTGTGCAA